jgi:hypothetical protein
MANTASSQAPPLIKVTVRLIEGGSEAFNVNPEEPVRGLKQRALAQLHVDPAPGSVYFLFLNNQRLEDGATLEAAGVTDGATLVLATEPQVGAPDFR